MAAQDYNTNNLALSQSEQVICSLAVQHDRFEAYVQASRSANIQFRLYATPTGGVRALIAIGTINSLLHGSRILWKSTIDGQDSIFVVMAGALFELSCIALDSLSNGITVTATLCGYDLAVDLSDDTSNGSGTLNQSEKILATINNAHKYIDALVNLVPARAFDTIFSVYATPGVGGVRTLLQTITIPKDSFGLLRVLHLTDSGANKFELVGSSSQGLTPSINVSLIGADNTGSSSSNSETGCFNILNYGALLSPNDIGPAVQLAINAALAQGGGEVCIPPVPVGVITTVPNQWGWTTFADADLNTDKPFSVQGIPGGTKIRVGGGTGNSILRIGNNGPGLVTVDGLIFTGNPAIGIDCTTVLDIRQTRIARLTRCEFWGIQVDGNLNGVVAIIADTVHVEDNLFVGCDYTGTSHKGGVVMISGMRDGCLVTTNRWDTNGIELDGIFYGKAASPQNGWLWFGGQGPEPPPTQATYGGVDVIDNHFAQAGSPLFQCALLPTQQSALFVIANARIIGNSFNTPTTFLNVGTSILADGCLRLFIRGEFEGAVAGSDCVKIGNCTHVKFEDCRFALENLQVSFTGPVEYCELDECPKAAFAGISAAPFGPTIIIGSGASSPSNLSEKINGARHTLICDPRTIETGTIAAWYRADLGITLNAGNVSDWDDSSGVGDPLENLAQAVAGQQPGYNPANLAFNGQATVGPFNSAANTLLASGIWVNPPPIDGLIVCVFNTSGAGTEILFRDVGGAGYELYQNATKNLQWFLSVILITPATDMNNPSIVAILMNDVVTKIYQNGISPIVVGNQGAVAPVGLQIGVVAGGWNGNIAELTIFRTKPSHEDFQRYMESLGVRYGIQVSN